MQRQLAYEPWGSSSRQQRRCPRCWRRGCRWGCQRAPALTAALSMAASHVPVTAAYEGTHSAWSVLTFFSCRPSLRTSLLHPCSWEHFRQVAASPFIIIAACLRDALQQLSRCLAAEGVAAALSTCGLHRLGRRLWLHHMRLQCRQTQYQLTGTSVDDSCNSQDSSCRSTLQLA